jgi:hypothetical protein
MLSPIKINEGAGNVILNATETTATMKVGKNPSTSNVAISAGPIKAKVTTVTTEIGKDPSTSNIAISTGPITAKQATFKSLLNEWLTYTKDNNTTQIPKSEVKLYAWARDVRRAHRDFKNNNKSTMTKQQEEQLLAANFLLEIKVTPTKLPSEEVKAASSTLVATLQVKTPKKRAANKTNTSPKTKKKRQTVFQVYPKLHPKLSIGGSLLNHEGHL